LGVPEPSKEMVQIKIIRDLSREMTSTLSELIPPKPACRNSQGKIIKQRNGKHTGGQNGFYISPLAQLILSDMTENGVTEATLKTITMAASWPDSNTLGIVLKVIERILPLVTSNSTYFPFVGGTLLTSLLHTLFSESPYSKENQHGLIHVISLIYNSISLGIRPVEHGGGGVSHPGQQNSDVALRVFASLPGATEQVITSLNQALINQKSTKQRRMLIQDFLQNSKQNDGDSGQMDSVLQKKLQSYLNLPEPVIDLKKRAEANKRLFDLKEADSKKEPLSSLFK
jgi:hypothetical protein